MVKRKPRPTAIYRIEHHGLGLYNSTTQSFARPACFDDPADYAERVREIWADQHPDVQVRLYVGKIVWEEVELHPIDPDDLDVQIVVPAKPHQSSYGVSITHKPTGLEVTATEEKSLLANKERALRILKAKLNEPFDHAGRGDQ